MNEVEPINSTTFRIRLIEDEVEIGDIEASDFMPHAKLKRWGEECSLDIKLAGEITETELEVEEHKVKSKYKVKQGDFELEVENEFYGLSPDTQNELGAFEFDIILVKKPPTNRLVFDIEAQGLTFHYQPELTQEEINHGDERPENVIGSYAVYHSTRSNIHASEADAQKYKAGKAFHIYRPKVEDAEGEQVWGELHIDEEAGTLTITIPQDFLDRAKYPVRHAAGATFGYTTIGTAGTAVIEDSIYGSWYECPAPGGVVSKLTAALLATLAHDTKCAIYNYVGDADAGTLVGGTNEILVPVTDPADWYDFTFAAPPDVTALTKYFLVAWGEATGGQVRLAYDTLVNKGIWLSRAYNGWPSPMAGEITMTHKFSIYATYATPVAGGGGAGGVTGAAGILLVGA